MSKKQSSWWDYAAHQTKSAQPTEDTEEELPTVAEILSGTTRDERRAGGIKIDSHDLSFLETTRTFARRVRKYWGI